MYKIIFLLAAMLCAVSAYPYPGDHLTPVTQIRNVYSSTNVTTSAWVQLKDATPTDATAVQTFDSSGRTLQLGYKPSGSTQANPTPLMIIFPGGNGQQPLVVPSGASLWVKAISGTANAGELDLNLFY